jgi:hypothetical protein
MILEQTIIAVPEFEKVIDKLANQVTLRGQSKSTLHKSAETSAERILRLTGFDPRLCPACKKGHMQIKREIPRIRSPAAHLPSLLRAACL